MDQLVSARAQEGHALLIDCRSLEATPIPLPFKEHTLAILDTRVKHQLANSAYNQRRAECEEGVRQIIRCMGDIVALRDVSPDAFDTCAGELPEVIRRRCRHVIRENERTLSAAEALRSGELRRFGDLMFASHDSLRDDYEVSCPELDLLVDAARSHSAVLGARMTGGGFGGCVIALVKREAFEQVVQDVSAKFERRFQRKPGVLRSSAGSGAAEMS
jgi:galactokinase